MIKINAVNAHKHPGLRTVSFGSHLPDLRDFFRYLVQNVNIGIVGTTFLASDKFKSKKNEVKLRMLAQQSAQVKKIDLLSSAEFDMKIILCNVDISVPLVSCYSLCLSVICHPRVYILSQSSLAPRFNTSLQAILRYAFYCCICLNISKLFYYYFFSCVIIHSITIISIV